MNNPSLPTFEQWRVSRLHELRTEFLRDYDWLPNKASARYYTWLKEKYQAEHTSADPNGAL